MPGAPPGAQSYSHQPPPPPCARHLSAEAIRGRSGKLGTHSAAPWPRPVYLQVSRRCRRSDQNFRKCTASNRCSPATHSGHRCACGYVCAHMYMCVSVKSRGTQGLSTHNASLPLLNNTIVEKALNLSPLASSSPWRGRREATHLPPTCKPPQKSDCQGSDLMTHPKSPLESAQESEGVGIFVRVVDTPGIPLASF